MAVAVHFPDGSIRDVPGQLRRLTTPQQPGAPVYEQVPLCCDSRWMFKRDQGVWMAIPRHGHLAMLHPTTPTWWSGIPGMSDAEDEGRSTLPKAGLNLWHSAA